MWSGGRRLVDTCTWLIVAHRHACTSSHSAERLNLCLSEKELFHMSMFPVTCALRLKFASCWTSHESLVIIIIITLPSPFWLKPAQCQSCGKSSYG